MSTPAVRSLNTTDRRTFLKRTSGTLAAASLASTIASRAYAGENNEIKVALVGCGGRGTGAAANALSTAKQGPVKLWAMADVYQDRLAGSHRRLQQRFKDQVDVPEERQFAGFDGYRKAIDAIDAGDVVLLATPPAFRPLHVEYAVDQGRHVFMEKSFAVDGPGIRRVLAAGKKADEKNLKVAGGLMCRHNIPLAAAVEQIHQGAIGEVITAIAYRMHGPVGHKGRQADESELSYQIRNYCNFTWLNGTFILDWLIHNLDVCCWIKDAWPVAAQGQGGRQMRDKPDQLFDHWAVEYTYPDGTRLIGQARHMHGTYSFFGDKILGTRGIAVLGEGIRNPKIYEGHREEGGKVAWRPEDGGGTPCQVEHDRLFDAIRNDKPHNETERCAYAALTGILGRMAGESGKLVTWEQALNSDVQLADVDAMNWDTPAPVQPDKDGEYPIAMPGFTKAF